MVCTSDVLALGALRHAAEQGLAVPDDLTITGFDGVPEAERAGLTTVRQPVLEKGRVAGQLLLQHGDGRDRQIRHAAASTARRSSLSSWPRRPSGSLPRAGPAQFFVGHGRVAAPGSARASAGS